MNTTQLVLQIVNIHNIYNLCKINTFIACRCGIFLAVLKLKIDDRTKKRLINNHNNLCNSDTCVCLYIGLYKCVCGVAEGVLFSTKHNMTRPFVQDPLLIGKISDNGVILYASIGFCVAHVFKVPIFYSSVCVCV